MKKLIIMLIVSFFVLACPMVGAVIYYDSNGVKHITQNPTEDCVIYRLLGNTTGYRLGLFVANRVAISQGLYTKTQGHEGVDNIRFANNMPTATVGSLVAAILSEATRATKVGAADMFIVLEGITEYQDNTEPIDDCTRYRINLHLDKQDALIRLVEVE